jgi:hypothetical protein
MGASKAKRKYNKATYRRYEFSVRLDSKLEYLLDRYTAKAGNGLSTLIKNLLCEHFGIIASDEIWIPVRSQNIDGNWKEIPNTDLDEITTKLEL